MIYAIWKQAVISSWKHSYQMWIQFYRSPTPRKLELNETQNPIRDYSNDPDPALEDPFTQQEKIGTGRDDRHPDQPPPSRPPNTKQKEREQQENLESYYREQQRQQDRADRERQDQDHSDWTDRDYGTFWGNQ